MIVKKETIQAVQDFSEKLDVQGRSLWQDARRRFFSNKAAMTSLVILIAMILAILILPLISPHAFDDQDYTAMSQAPSFNHWFGTDSLGRDLYVRTLKGGLISMAAGLSGAIVAVIIGTLYGAISGYLAVLPIK